MLDVLGYLEEIPVCTGYDIDGEVTTEFPCYTGLNKAKPVYEFLRGWKCDITGINSFAGLPDKAKRYIERIEKLIKVPIRYISVGPKREEIIEI